MEFFIYPFQLDEKERYVLWFTDDVDGLLTDQNGRIATFSSVQAARAFAESQNLSASSTDSLLLDLRWIKQNPLTVDNIDCNKVLDAWNFFADVAVSLPDKSATFTALDKRPSRTYDKLFWGNNLPAVTPPGEHYEPEWSRKEVVKIQTILQCGLELFIFNLD